MSSNYVGNRITSAERVQDKPITLEPYGPVLTYTLTVNNTTPSVLNKRHFVTANTVGTTISAFNDGVAGQEIFVVFGDANTTIDFSGTTLKGNAGVDFVGAVGDALRGFYDGTNWYMTVIDGTV